ncbi:MAG: hypothetical protein HY770_04290 [Chitinivibrionia bacterium]|nr:hypothetical protein [Chitinivibrionia bacterium]
MRLVLLTCAAIVLLVFGAAAASAQTPMVQIVFDEAFTAQTHVCINGEIDSAFVVARNFNSWVVGIEFAIAYPASIPWFGDTGTPELTMGNTKNGISMVWQLPLNGYETAHLCTIWYRCNNCLPDTPITVIPHPISGFVRATRYPDLAFINAIGWTSIFCPDIIPAEQTTWGTVKALYQD